MTKEKKLDYEVTEGNVFAALGIDEHEELLAKSKLLSQVSSLIKKSGLSQEAIGKKLGISQSRVSLLVGGRLSEFSTDSLLHFLSALGCDIKIQATKPRSRVKLFKKKGRISVNPRRKRRPVKT